jgi:hypothetical protein
VASIRRKEGGEGGRLGRVARREGGEEGRYTITQLSFSLSLFHSLSHHQVDVPTLPQPPHQAFQV